MTDEPVSRGRPWWAPDARGFLAMAIVTMTYTALMVRMFSPSNVDDKMLDTMITILFSTCLVTVYNFSFGSSQTSANKDDAQNKLVDKLTPPVLPNGAGPSGAAPAVIAAATAAAVEAAKAVAPAAAEAAAPAAAAAAAPPAADIAVPPAVDAELDRRGIADPDKPKE